MLENTFSITLLTFVGAAANAATPAPATDVTALQAKVAELESRLAEVEGGDQWLTEQRATEIRSLVQDVLNDADTRASLQGSGMTAGWDKGFFLASADGKFKLQIAGQLQIRYAYNYLDDDTQDKNREGFEVRRAKLEFKGHIFDKTWKYEFQPTWSRQSSPPPSGSAPGAASSNAVLENAWVMKEFDQGFYVKFGQFKSPFMLEENTSSKRQLLVERSLINEEFNQDYSQGVELGWTGEQFRVKGMYGDGFNTLNTSALTRVSEWGAVTGRADFKIAGDWKQFDEFTSWDGESFGVMVGGAGHVERQEFGTTDNGEVLMYTGTADVSVKFGGANLYAAYVYRWSEPNGGDDTQAWGLMIQGGIFIVPNEWEIAARYEYGDQDGAGQDPLSVATIGVNRYFDKHNLKWQTDVGWSFQELTSGWSSLSGADYRNTNSDDGQLVFRSQFQLLF